MNQTQTNRYAAEAGILWATYILYLFVVTAPIGFAVSGYKIWRYRGPVSEASELSGEDLSRLSSHHLWLMNTMIGTTIFLMMAIGTAYYFFGYIIGILAIGWWFYRLGRGLVLLIEHKPTPAGLRRQITGNDTDLAHHRRAAHR